jgi:hypothetical protein
LFVCFRLSLWSGVRKGIPLPRVSLAFCVFSPFPVLLCPLVSRFSLCFFCLLFFFLSPRFWSLSLLLYGYIPSGSSVTVSLLLRSG